jgi:hypothetical protein
MNTNILIGDTHGLFPSVKNFFKNISRQTENYGEKNGDSSIISRRTRQRVDLTVGRD